MRSSLSVYPAHKAFSRVKVSVLVVPIVVTIECGMAASAPATPGSEWKAVIGEPEHRDWEKLLHLAESPETDLAIAEPLRMWLRDYVNEIPIDVLRSKLKSAPTTLVLNLAWLRGEKSLIPELKAIVQKSVPESPLSNQMTRCTTVGAIGATHDRAALPFLVRTLKDEPPTPNRKRIWSPVYDTREALATAIVECGGPGPFEDEIRKILSDPIDDNIQLVATKILQEGGSEDKKTAEVLIALIRKETKNKRIDGHSSNLEIQAVAALAQNRHPDTKKLLTEAIIEEEDPVATRALLEAALLLFEGEEAVRKAIPVDSAKLQRCMTEALRLYNERLRWRESAARSKKRNEEEAEKNRKLLRERYGYEAPPSSPFSKDKRRAELEKPEVNNTQPGSKPAEMPAEHTRQ